MSNDSGINHEGLALLIVIVLGWTGSCFGTKAHERQETESICRRAIEREFKVPSEQAKQVIDSQRAWEGR